MAEADVVVVREDEAEALKDAVQALREESDGLTVWVIRRTLNLGELG